MNIHYLTDEKFRIDLDSINDIESYKEKLSIEEEIDISHITFEKRNDEDIFVCSICSEEGPIDEWVKHINCNSVNGFI